MYEISTKSFWATWGVPVCALSGMTFFLLDPLSDQVLFFYLNRLSFFTGEGMWSCLTVFGDEFVAITLGLPFMMWRREMTWTMLLAILFSYAIVHGLKPLCATDRPSLVFQETAWLHVIGPVFLKGSFPSGHTTTIFTLISLHVLTFRNVPIGLFGALLLFGLAVGMSRCVVGVHWPVDVMAGMAFGWLSGLLSSTLIKRRPIEARFYYPIIALFLVCSVFVITWHDPGYPYSRPFQIILSSMSLLVSISYFVVPKSILYLRPNWKFAHRKSTY